jgi:uncharacterized membrane protein YsdA (DUF1294 family)/cold shock CspA family protein
MRYQGRLSNWNDDKGYGFVTPNGGGDAVFVHISAFVNRRRRPVDGELITYGVVKDSRNRLRAAEVRYPSEAKPVARQVTPRYAMAAGLIIPFGCVVVALAFLGKTPILVPLAYALVSCLTFAVYGVDKSAAMNGRWRTQEGTLHLLSLAGGWPGALVAQQMFRHKSRKAEFQVAFWITVVLNCGVFAWSATDAGASFIRTTFGVAAG